MKISAEALSKMDSKNLRFIAGDLAAVASRPWPPEMAEAGSLTYAASNEKLTLALASKASIIIATKKALPPAPPALGPGRALFETPNTNAAMALINPLFDTKNLRFKNEIHKTAVLSPSAQIGQNVRVGAYSVIGDNAQLSDECIIGPHCVIESNAKIGSGSLLHAFVFIGADCEIGKSCEIHPHVTIGSDGFGYATRENQAPLKVPQLGRVVLEDHVEIGAGCAIDRATLTETRICQGTKFDNLVHIAHNCKVGANSLLAAGFMMAGSSTLGSNFSCGGGVVVADHLNISDHVTLGGRSVATKDIPAPGVYAGYPLVPVKEALKYLASLPSLPEIRKQLHEIRKHLGLSKE